MEIVKNQSWENLANIITELMLSSKPIWIARIGGSDYDYYNYIINSQNEDVINDILKSDKYYYFYKLIKSLNGFFDKNNNMKISLLSSKIYIDSVLNSDFILLLGEIYWQITNKNFKYSKFVKGYTKNKNHQCSSYSIIESGMAPECNQKGGNFFLNSFKIWGKNKKILIISPFEKTIKYQTDPERINNLLKNYTFPNCEFKTYGTPITYNFDSELKEQYFEKVSKPYNNWIELAEKMIDDISKIDFDVAFISAGIYTMYLGNEIKKMGKKAIYIGGMLNVFFNIYGKRYEDQYYKNIQNLDFQVKVMDDFGDLLDNSEKNSTNEALNAYF